MGNVARINKEKRFNVCGTFQLLFFHEIKFPRVNLHAMRSITQINSSGKCPPLKFSMTEWLGIAIARDLTIAASSEASSFARYPFHWLDFLEFLEFSQKCEVAPACLDRRK
jgi:hypothetical protein